jgi:chloramphenicol O-acetyltransferase type A
MKTINLETWSRRDHFNLFKNMGAPHFNMCANVEITNLYPIVKDRNIKFTLALTYIVARAANDVPEFRFRIRGDEVVEHEIVHPSITILTEGDLFSFCTFNYCDDFSSFAASAAKQMTYIRDHPTIEDPPGRDDLLFMTAIPWVSFTSFMHPMPTDPVDSIPRFAWGKFFEEGDRVKIPLSVQGHHALMDGLHIGRYYDRVGIYLNRPETVLV